MCYFSHKPFKVLCPIQSTWFQLNEIRDKTCGLWRVGVHRQIVIAAENYFFFVGMPAASCMVSSTCRVVGSVVLFAQHNLLQVNPK